MNYQLNQLYQLIVNSRSLPLHPDRDTYGQLLDELCRDIEAALQKQYLTLKTSDFNVFINEQYHTLQSYQERLTGLRKPYKSLIRSAIQRLLRFIETQFGMASQEKAQIKSCSWLGRLWNFFRKA